MDRLTSMRVFCTVAEAGSFSRAAERLGMANSAVTKHVNALEECLGARLLNRTTRRLSRTEAGQAYYERAREVLADIDELDSLVGSLAETPRGTLRVTTPLSFGVQYLGRAIGSFMARYPEVRIDLQMNDRVVDLLDEGLDVAIRIARLVDSSHVARRISETRVVACASPAYLQRHGRPSHPGELAAHRCLAYGHGSGTGDDWRAQGPDGEAQVTVPWVMRANNGDVLRTIALGDAGIALLPTFLVGQDLAAGRLVEVLPDWSFGVLGVHAVYPHRRLLSPKVRAFVEHLQQVLPPVL